MATMLNPEDFTYNSKMVLNSGEVLELEDTSVLMRAAKVVVHKDGTVSLRMHYSDLRGLACNAQYGAYEMAKRWTDGRAVSQSGVERESMAAMMNADEKLAKALYRLADEAGNL